jgi:hypothetical protein
LLGSAIVGVSLLALVTVILKDPGPSPSQPAEQTAAQSDGDTPPQEAAPSAKKGDSQTESAPHDQVAHADEVDRILGHGLKPAPESHWTPPSEPPPSLPEPKEARPTAPPDRPPPLPDPPKTKADTPPPPQPPKPADNPPPPPKKPTPPAADDNAIAKRLQANEEELRRQLLAVPELRLISDLEIQGFRAMEQKTTVRGVSREQVEYAFNVRLNQAMCQAARKEGLPVQSGPKCQLDYAAATIVQTLSKDLRDMGFVSVPGTPGLANFLRSRGQNAAVAIVPGKTADLDTAKQKMEELQQWCDQNKVEKFRGALATLLQMLQVEDVPTRLLLVRELAKVKTAGATAALAKRALVDLSPEVRQAAVEALRKRPALQYVPVLLQGLRYPWVPVADHAAVALRTLKPEGVGPKLVEVLAQFDSAASAPDPKTKKRTVYELVRLNHMRNCLLCHAPSADAKDGLVPTPGQPLPRLYYAGQSGDFVRADITFLRQDFSVNLDVKAPGPWPKEQRFDFVTRTRTLKPDETPDIVAKSGGFPQRDAVLYALRGLTGKDVGGSTEKWRDLLGIPTDKKTKDTSDRTTIPKKAVSGSDKITAPAKDISPRP